MTTYLHEAASPSTDDTAVDEAHAYRLILENIPAVVYQARFREPGSPVRVLGPQLNTMLGCSAHALSTGPSLFLDLIHPGDRERYREALARTLAQDRPLDIEYRLAARDGHVVWVRDRAVPTPGVPGLCDGVLVDITERRLAEEALAESERRYVDLAAGSIQGVIVTTPDWSIRYANPALAQMLGYDSREELVALGSGERIVAPHERERIQRYRAELVEGGGAPARLEFEAQRKDGSIVVVENVARVVQWGSEQLFQCTLVDVTARRRAESHLRVYRDMVAQSGDYLVLLSRDLRYRVVNTALLHARRLREDELLGRPVASLFAPQVYRDEIEPRLRRALAGEDVAFEQWAQYPDGRRYLLVRYTPFRDARGEVDGRRYLAARYTPFRDARGEVDGVLVAARDITQRWEADQSIRLFQEMVAQSGDYLSLVGPDLRYRVVNPTYAKALGMPVEAIEGKPLVVLDEPDLFEREVRPRLERCFAGEDVEYEIWQQLGTRGRRYLSVHYSPFRDARGNITGVLVHGRDLTARRLYEESLRRWREMIAQSGDLLALVGPDLRYRMVNPAYARAFGKTDEEMIGLRLMDLIGEERFENGIRQEVERCLAGEEVSGERWLDLPALGRRFYHVRYSPFRDADGHIDGYVAVARDLTDRRLAEEEVRGSRERLRAFSARLEEARENERAVIARDVHDDLGQTLTALTMELSLLGQHIPRDQAGRLDAALDLAGRAIADVRRIASSLRPPILDDLGLHAAMEWMLAQFAQRTGLACSIDADPAAADGLPSEVAVAVFRVFQEALTNVARHASARSVRVRARCDGARFELEVLDDGVGFDPQRPANRRSIGLIGIRERALELGGAAEIGPAGASGTRVHFWFPWRGRAAG